jgi:lipopolysaccharide transport system permease protein
MQIHAKSHNRACATFAKSFWHNRHLIWRLTERDILSRYKGSAIGAGWSAITPLAMLAVYTFVFSQVFRARWGSLDEHGPAGFAVNLFAGLIVFTIFSECVGKAAGLITSNPNYVKKVIFPLDALSWVTVGSALFHGLISIAILLIFELVVTMRSIPLTVLWLPIVWVPLILGTQACVLLLSAAGVFLRDIGQATNIGLNMIMFLSPIFFPLSALPPRWQPILGLNPLAIIIEETRKVMIQGSQPSFTVMVTGIITSYLCCVLAFKTFSKAQRAFADVI